MRTDSRDKISVELDLSVFEQIRICRNSLERVLNNAVRVGEAAQDKLSGSDSEFGSTLWQDAEELKPVATKIWNAVQDAIRRSRAGEKPSS
jgi:hypothetical protein